MSTVTMQELELEHAELLPRRETLWGGFTVNNGLQAFTINGNNVANGNSVTVQDSVFGSNSTSTTSIGGGNQNVGGLQITG
jgi:hypothetical protein